MQSCEILRAIRAHTRPSPAETMQDPDHHELLSEAIPGIKRVGMFWDPSFPPAALQVTELERAARVLNIELKPVEVRRADALDEAVRTVIGHGAHALIVTTAQLFAEQQRRLAELTLERRLPTMWYRREPVEAGGLMSYGTNFADMYRRAATYVDKILKGAKPADLPVEQPATFELVINLKTAKALGLTIPQTVLQRATKSSASATSSYIKNVIGAAR